MIKITKNSLFIYFPAKFQLRCVRKTNYWTFKQSKYYSGQHTGEYSKPYQHVHLTNNVGQHLLKKSMNVAQHFEGFFAREYVGVISIVGMICDRLFYNNRVTSLSLNRNVSTSLLLPPLQKTSSFCSSSVTGIFFTMVTSLHFLSSGMW